MDDQRSLQVATFHFLGSRVASWMTRPKSRPPPQPDYASRRPISGAALWRGGGRFLPLRRRLSFPEGGTGCFSRVLSLDRNPSTDPYMYRWLCAMRLCTSWRRLIGQVFVVDSNVSGVFVIRNRWRLDKLVQSEDFAKIVGECSHLVYSTPESGVLPPPSTPAYPSSRAASSRRPRSFPPLPSSTQRMLVSSFSTLSGQWSPIDEIFQLIYLLQTEYLKNYYY